MFLAEALGTASDGEVPLAPADDTQSALFPTLKIRSVTKSEQAEQRRLMAPHNSAIRSWCGA
jgi:hypothetical protein